MRFTRQWQLVVVIVLLCASATAEMGGDERIRVLVYDHAGVPASILEQAGREAVRIFRDAGVELEWVKCPGDGTAADCRNLDHRYRLILNVLLEGKTVSDSVYGDAFLGEDGTGEYADIFFGPIDEAHHERKISESRLLGAVAAHEIGHLLLGLRAHARLGIMSPRWSSEQIRQVGMGTLMFTREQAHRMREHVNRYASARSLASAKSYASAKASSVMP